MPTVLLLGTLDTKGYEYAYLRDRLLASGVEVLVVDVGINEPSGIFHSTLNTSYEPMVILAVYAPAGAEDVLKTLPDFIDVPAGSNPRVTRN